MTDEYSKPPALHEMYLRLMPRMRDARTLLELGVRNGESLRYWVSELPTTTVVGVDVNPSPTVPKARTFTAAQQDTVALDRITATVAPEGWDIIIDDASHLGSYTRTSFRHLYARHLTPGGTYIIEDWRTGYDAEWPDGQRAKPSSDQRMSRVRTTASSTIRRAARRIAARMRRDGRLWRLGSQTYARVQRADVRQHHHSHTAGMVGVIKQIVDEVDGAVDRPLSVGRMVIEPHAVLIEKPGKLHD